MSSPAVAVTGPRVARASRIATAVALIALHIPLALVMRSIPMLATIHAGATLAAGLVYAATTRRLQRLAIVVGYITGCEVLWRMCKAAVFWEFGKYASVAVLLVGVARLPARRTVRLAAAYFLLLVPSSMLTLDALPLSVAREQISFALSGPLCLACAVVFFSSIRLGAGELRGTFLALIAPVIGIAALSFQSTRAATEIEFVNAANAVTSGGFGPNQVSSMLGLAVLFLLLLAFDARIPWRIRLPGVLVAVVLAAQSALTFSRGGIALAFLGALAALVFLVRGNARARLSVLIISAICGLLGRYVIEPQLEEATGGKLGDRYSNLNSTGRDRFAATELEMFAEHPALGVGPGVGTFIRKDQGGVQGASHTEYTRMLAEHGILGALALCCLVWLALGALRPGADPTGRSTATALVVWSLLFMAVYATRLAAPAFVLGLSHAASRMTGKPLRTTK